MAQSEIEAHFGLGNQADRVIVGVYWPSTDTFVRISGVVPNKRLKVILPETGYNIIQSSIAGPWGTHIRVHVLTLYRCFIVMPWPIQQLHTIKSAYVQS